MASLLETHPDSFVHLHLHTQYSLLDGAIRLKDLVKKAQEFGVPAIAQTDHGNMFGAIDFYFQCKSAGIKPILGSEIYFTAGSRFEKGSVKKNTKVVGSQDEEESRHQIHHLILLCKNQKGYENLCKLLSKAYLEGFYYKPRADIEILREYSEGLICTTACLKGEVGYNFFTDQDEKAHDAIHKLQSIFGDDLYLEIQENGIPEQKIVNEKVVAFARANNIKLVATNDCHYLTPEDAAAHEVLLCVQTGKTIHDEKRMKLTTNEFYYKSPQTMREQFHYAPDACDNTLLIADQCNVEFKFKDEKGNQIYYLPDYPIETSETIQEYFTRMSQQGLDERFDGPHFAKLRTLDNWETEIKPKYQERLDGEVEMILKMGFPGYFLIVSDFIKWAKKNDIPVGPGRGSGAGSLVAYSLSITNIDPIPFNLLFERFINPERVSMPDFDVDFCQDRRGEVIEYVTQKYGTERVGQIITFGKLQTKAVLKDVARVYGLTFAESDIITKLIPDELGISLEESLEKEPKLTELIESDPRVKQIFKISLRLEGLLRHASIHAAGVIITNEPLVKYCPLFKGRLGEQVVQFDKDFSEKIGLVKFDFLGLKTLTVIKHAVDHVRENHDPTFDIEAIDYEDKFVFDFVSKGETIGVFQLESSGMIDLCKRIQPNSVDDITAINALYRPGPLNSGMVDDFIEIKHGRKEISYTFPELQPVLKDTYGIIVYQEQVMNIARTIAGYSLGQADMLRRAMGKKKPEEMAKHKEIFKEGAKERGFNVDKADALFDLMAGFAEYGFNKSHAVAYAVIAYQTAFLKRYYPAEFFAGLLSTELGDADKIGQYISDVKRFGVEVLPPNVNESIWLFNVVGGNIRFGMGAIKNVGENAVEMIIAERKENGPFKSFIDFCERIDYKVINKRVVESLIKVGAFDACEKFNRRTLLSNMEMLMSYGSKKQEEKQKGVLSLFDDMMEEGSGSSDATSGLKLELNEEMDFSDKEKLDLEAELMGIFISGHPLDKFKSTLEQMCSMNLKDIQEVPGDSVRDMVLGGMITSSKVILTKKGDKMCFAQLEDLSGKIECVIFPRTFAEYETILASGDPVVIIGQVKLSESPRKMLPTRIQLLKENAEERVTGVQVNVELEGLNEQKLNRLKQVLLTYRGTVPLSLVFDQNGSKARLPLGDDYLVNPTPKLAASINELFNSNSVKLIVDGKLESLN